MRRVALASLLAASVQVALLPMFANDAMAQQATPAPAPVPALNRSQLPALPPVLPGAEMDQMALIGSGAGAAIGILIADIVTGGMLLAPLGIPSAGTLLTLGGGAAAGAVAPTYSVAQRLLAGVATAAAAVVGGYAGTWFVRSHPDFVRLGD